MDNNQQENQREDNELMYIYEWVDSVPLSRPKKNIARDFGDGVLMAELIKHHIPKLVDLHNYPNASSTKQKSMNWNTLNTKVFKKLGLSLSKQEIVDIISSKPLYIENLLKKVYKLIQKYTPPKEGSGEMLNISGGNENINMNMNKKGDEMIPVSYGNYSNANEQQLRKVIQEKDNSIQELKYIIEILEMKLKSSSEAQATLEKKVQELSEFIAEKGLDME